MSSPAIDFTPEWIQRSLEIVQCYQQLLGKELISPVGTDEEVARRLFEAPFVVVAHGTEADPLLNYGNQQALALWKATPDQLLGMPSRLTAEPMEREERAQMLEQTTRQGYIDDYRGVRISLSGQRFLIEQAVVWNLKDAAGNPAGQAATFADWTPLS